MDTEKAQLFRIGKEWRKLGTALFLLMVLLTRFLFTRAVGILIVAIVLYTFSEGLLGVTAFGPGELVIYLSSLEKDYKIAVISSLITVIGFLLAFSTSSAAVKEQLLLQYKSQVAEEVSSFADDVCTVLTAIRIKADLIIECKAQIDKCPSSPETVFVIDYLSERSDELKSEITRLSALVSSGHSLKGRHSILLSANNRLDVSFSKALQIISKLSEGAWLFIPSSSVTSAEEAEIFAKHLDVNKAEQFISLYRSGYPKISELCGSVRGALLSGVLGLTWGNLRAVLAIMFRKGYLRRS